jgi:hypothetical protein
MSSIIRWLLHRWICFRRVATADAALHPAAPDLGWARWRESRGEGARRAIPTRHEPAWWL